MSEISQESGIEPLRMSLEVRQELDRLGLDEFEIGDWIIDDHGNLLQLTGFEFRPRYHAHDPLALWYFTNHSNSGYKGLAENDLAGKNGRKQYYRLHDTPENATEEAFRELQKPTEETTTDPTSVAITAADGIERVKVIEREIERKATRAMVLRLLVERKLNALRTTFARMERQLAYTRRVIAMLEAYLGVYQEILLIRDGDLAPADTPIVIRQLILHMDEEVGSVDEMSNGQIGIDFQNIDRFDDWLLADPRHVDTIIPELKCVVALRPSRQKRQYSNNFFDDTDKNNHFVYLLIRNGEKLWRVWANMKMSGYDRLFPDAKTMEDLMLALSDENLSEDQALKLKNKQLDWQSNAVLLEGLLDRTDVFQPMQQRVSLFDMESYTSGRLMLIRDAEPSLDTGTRVAFKDWKKEINSRIGRGSRVLISPFPYDSWSKDNWRYYFQNWTWRSHPEFPRPGVYTIEAVIIKNERTVEVIDYEKDERGNLKPGLKEVGRHTETRCEEYLKFLYMPQGYDAQVWVRDPVYVGMMQKDREKRIGFYVGRNDDNVLNYDEIDLDTVEYYIHNRLERRHYQEYLPVLYGIRRDRLAEREYEKPFVQMICNEFECDEALVWEGVRWWKYKVINHRGLREDDAKAWRMIRRWVRRKLDGEAEEQGGQDGSSDDD